MWVAKIDVWPWGNTADPMAIERIVGTNDGTGDHEFGNYDVWFAPKHLLDHDDASLREFAREFPSRGTRLRVEHFPRGNGQGHLAALVAECVARRP